MRSLLQDLQQTRRGLVKAPGFTAVAILTIALGIGANTAVYSLVAANFVDLRARVRTLDHVVAHSWTNANLTDGDRPERVQGFAVIGVLSEGVRHPAPGATVEAAPVEVAGIMKELEARYPETNAKWGSNVQPFLPDLTRMLQPVPLVLLAAVGFVLLVSCANMANLMLARGVARQRELFVLVLLVGAGLMVRTMAFLSERSSLAAALLSRAVASQLVGVPALDAVTYLSVAALLFTAALLAVCIPARRVSRIDPMAVLRTEGA